MEYEEHEKRAWSVDFSCTEPSMLVVFGSDDCKVFQNKVPVQLYWFFPLYFLRHLSTSFLHPCSVASTPV
jgi:hypothetical protein